MPENARSRSSRDRSPASSAEPERPPQPSPAVVQAAREIERLGALRAFRGRDISIRSMVETAQTRASKRQRQLGALVELWEALLPPDLVARTALTAFRGGVLHVKVDSSAVTYELDRLLRESVLADMRNQFSGTLTRVKVTVGDLR